MASESTPLRIGMMFGLHVILDAGQYAELAFDRHVELMSIVDHFLRQRDIFLVGEMRAVDHHRREAHVDARFAKLERVAVIEVQHDLRMGAAQLLGVLDGPLSHIAQQRLIGVLASAARHLQNDGRLGLDRSLNDGLHLLHVVEVERSDRILPCDGLLEHLAGVHQTQILVVNHN